MSRCAALLLVMLLTGCATHSPKPAPPTAEDGIRQRLLTAYDAWKGTPYRFGGESRHGIDCSAFVQQVYRQAFAIELPRTTKAQLRSGIGVHARWPQAGDLLFFQPRRGPRHVGIYLGDGRFIHASTSRGVTQARLADRHWRSILIGVRRVLR